MNRAESVALMIKGTIYSMPEAQRAEFERHYQYLKKYVEDNGEFAMVAVGLICAELNDE